MHLYYKIEFVLRDKHNTEVVYDEELEKNVEKHIFESVHHYTDCEEEDMCVQTLKENPPEEVEIPLGYELHDVRIVSCSVNDFISKIKNQE